MMKVPVVIRNVLILSALALVESVHLLVLAALAVDALHPLKYDPAVWNKYFPFLQSAIRPNHDFFLYHCWLVFATGIQAIVVWRFRRSLEEESLWSRLRAYMLNEAVFLFLLIFCVFKIILWQSPAWAVRLFYAVLVISWLVRIFWPEVTKAIARLTPFAKRLNLKLWPDVLMVAAIIIFIFPTDIESILARDFIYERLHHFDGVILGAGWSLLCGLRLYADVLCQYGLGMTVAITRLASAMGGLSYEHVVWVCVYAAIFYFLGAYFFLRFWLGSFLLAAAGVLLGIKFQMFHMGVAPIIWGFPSVTVLRYFFDTFFLFFILYHVRTRRAWSLTAACICSAVSLAYMTDTGAYQWFALCVYLGFLYVEEKKSSVFLYAPLSLLMGLAVASAIEGPAFFSKAFWQGAIQHGSLFLNGFGNLPIYTNLSQGYFFAFFMGLLIPLAYVFSIIFTAAEYALDKKRRENVFVVVLCAYGLGLYHYYICRSAPTSYHAVDLPFVFLLMYWARRSLPKASSTIFFLSLGALLTNFLFVQYPNMLDLSHDDWAKEKEYYHQHIDFEEDVRLIQQLTSPSERIAVIANDQVKITMDAHRAPLFYFFPFDYPNPEIPDYFSATDLLTFERLNRTLSDLKTAAPRYVFVDKVFFRGQLPPEIYRNNAALKILYQFLHAHYVDSGMEARHLLAIKAQEL